MAPRSRKAPRYPLVDPIKPELFRDQFPYTEVPRIRFDGVDVPVALPDEIWITDTTFRDGQQSRPPYTPAQIAEIFRLLSELGGRRGVIRQTEFFIYSRRDRQALTACQEQGRKFPEITSWIRADVHDLTLVKDLGIAETGILTSMSDYHIHLKLHKTRAQALDDYYGIVSEALARGIRPRCHLEDITRADLYGCCLPFAERLLDLMRQGDLPIKLRLCDTMGYGVTYPGAVLPRSVPRLCHAFAHELGYPSELLEWHGHNDFHKVHVNAATAWLHGCAALNASLLGYGERTGNPPLEAAVIEYLALRGTTDGMDPRVITRIANYFRDEVHAPIPANQPFVGEEFNVTRAGIHADGLMKHPEIYNPFDTELILNRPIRVMVTDKSGMAGIAHWINENVPTVRDRVLPEVGKRHPGIRAIHEWVTAQYEQGRTTSISSEELLAQARHFLPALFVSDFEHVRQEALRRAKALALRIGSAPEIHDLVDTDRLEHFLHRVVHNEPSIQLLAMTDPEGRRIGQVHTQRGERGLFRDLRKQNFANHDWFVHVLRHGSPFCSDLFFSRYTNRLIVTVALPITARRGGARRLLAVMDIDFIFDDLAKQISTVPDEVLATDPTAG